MTVIAPGGAGGASRNSETQAYGAGGAGGTTSGYDVQLNGGTGGTGTTGAAQSGGGGGSAGDLTAGGNATGNTAGTAGAGFFQSGSGGGVGRTSSLAGGSPGLTAPGGGGGGALRMTSGTSAGAVGSGGMVALTYTINNDPAVVKANNTDALNLGSSWVGGTAPDGTKAALWDSTVTSDNAVSLGADTTWKGIRILNPGGNVAINAGNTLTLNSTGLGLDLSEAAKDLTLNCPLVVGSNHTWSVGSGRTLTLAGGISGSSGVSLHGAGILKLPNPGSGLTQTLSGTLTVATTDGTLFSDRTSGSGTLSTTLGTPSRSFASTLNIKVDGGTPGADNLVNLTGTAGFVNAGVFYNGADFAWRNAVNGYVRAPSYGEAGTSAANACTASTHSLVNADTSLSPGANLTLSSLKITGNTALTISTAVRLINNAYVSSGGNNSITATTGFQSSGSEFIFRVDGSTDQLTINGNTIENPVNCSLVKSGAGTLIFANNMAQSANTYVNGGTVEVRGSYTPATKNLFIASGATFIYNSASALTLSGGIIGGGSLTKNGASTLTLSASNTFSGTTKVLGGMITLNQALALQNSILDMENSIASSSTTTGLKTGTGVTTLTFGGLNGTSAPENLAALFNAANGYTTVTALTLNPGAGATPSYSGIIANGAANMTLTKTGAGTQTLGGANTYSGATNINGGTLLVNNTTGTGTGSGNVSVTVGTLGGNGSITGSVTIGNSDGSADAILAPGNNSIDSIDSGALTFNSDGSYAVELNGTSVTSDVTNVTGTVTINAATTLTVSVAGTLAASQQYVIVSNNAADPVTGTFAGLAQDAVVGNFGGTTLKISYTGGDGNDIVLYTATSGSPYTTWAGSTVFTDDANGDGVKNGLAWILGAASTTVSALDKLPTVSTPTGYLQLNFTRKNPYSPAKLYVEYGTNLTGWTKLEIPAASGTIGGDIVVTVSPGPPDAVTVKIPTTSASGGKLFARLSATEN